MKKHELQAKKNVEKYELRIPGTSAFWVDIIVESRGDAGRIFIVSDYDSSGWTYSWGSCGCPFKEFLTKLDIHYAAHKFVQDDHFDIEATIKGMKRDLKEAHLFKGDLDLWADIRRLEDCTCREEFVSEAWHSSFRRYVGNPSIVTCITPQFKRFWNEAWPVFVDILKNEIDNQEFKA